MGMRDAGGLLKRRGLLAGAALLVAGLARLARPTPAAAGMDGDVVLGGNNTPASDTIIRMDGVSLAQSTGLLSPQRAIAVMASGSRFGLAGGVRAGGASVGQCFFPAPAPSEIAGVYGVAVGPAPGVRGESTLGVGVLGVAIGSSVSSANPSGTAPPAVKAGLAGVSDTGTGVYGVTTSGEGMHGSSQSGVGIVGQSTSAYGVYGFSQNTNGVVGQSGGNGAALVGLTTNGIGVYGGVLTAGTGLAGYFDGPVFVKSLTVAGGPKSAAVPLPDGSHGRLYCLEAPESWFEDVGRAQLVNGQATITLAPDFAAVVQGDDYHVFLTEYDTHNALVVTGQTARGFMVRSDRSPTASGTFGYRVMARRKDSPGTRLEKVTLPNAVEFHDPLANRRPAPDPVPTNRPAPGVR